MGIFHGKGVRYRAISRHWEGYWRRTIFLGATVFDFLRAIAGAWLLTEAVIRTPETKGMMRHAPFLLEAMVLPLSTGLQTLVPRERDVSLAPFGFVIGLLVGYLPLQITGFALILAGVIAVGARVGAIFFPMLAITTVAIGYLLTQRSMLMALGVAAASIMLPWLLTLLFTRPFVVAYRARAEKFQANRER